MGAASTGRVALVGFEDQDNLGLRYLSSTLHSRGHDTRIIQLGSSTCEVARQVCAYRPDIVGFSLIFQYLLPAFADLVDGLRRDGMTAHFTIGGHYPSFEPTHTLRAIAGLDSVVRFEGEDTLAELTEAVLANGRWQDVPGIAWRDGEIVRTSPERIGRADLDEFAWPDRDDIRYERQRIPTASILGGRGSYLGTVAGVILITLLQSILSVMQMPEAGRQIIYGIVIIVMLLLYGRAPANR